MGVSHFSRRQNIGRFELPGIESLTIFCHLIPTDVISFISNIFPPPSLILGHLPNPNFLEETMFNFLHQSFISIYSKIISISLLRIRCSRCILSSIRRTTFSSLAFPYFGNTQISGNDFPAIVDSFVFFIFILQVSE